MASSGFGVAVAMLRYKFYKSYDVVGIHSDVTTIMITLFHCQFS